MGGDGCWEVRYGRIRVWKWMGASGDGGSGIAEVVRWFWEGKGGRGWFCLWV